MRAMTCHTERGTYPAHVEDDVGGRMEALPVPVDRPNESGITGEVVKTGKRKVG